MTFAKISGLLQTTGKKNWPIADGRAPSNDSKNNCGTHMDPNPLLVPKEANGQFK